jgi:hypothetical protein
MASTVPATDPAQRPTAPPDAVPNIDHIAIDDGAPVDGMYSEKQMRLLASTLYDSWPGPGEGRPFLALANVGLFYAVRQPPVVPDVMLSIDVEAGDLSQKRYNTYFLWEYEKTPDVVVEIVSNREGDELGRKRALYERIGIRFYVVWDPLLYLGDKRLHVFILHGKQYVANGLWFAEVGLGLKEWRGLFEGHEDLWLRWCDEKGELIPTAAERAEHERQRAEHERQRADELAARLRALGVDPDAR